MKKLFIVFMALMMLSILGCKDESVHYGMSAPYEINHYADTIAGYLILTTVCNSNDNKELSVSTLSLGKIDAIEIK